MATDARRAIIDQIYREHLRQPNDITGMEYWAGRGDIADGDLQNAIRKAAGMPTPEFAQPATDFQNREDYVRTLYQNELGRTDIDEGGLDYWTRRRLDLSGDDLIKAMRGAAGYDNTLYEDPAYSAFMRSYNQRSATVNADKVAREREIANTRDIAAAGFQRKLTEGNRQVDDDAESRGMFRSGGRLNKRARLAEGIAFERSTAENQYANQASELNRAASGDLSELSRKRDEEEIAARRRLSTRTIQDNARAQP